MPGHPKRPFSGKLNLRLGSELHARVAAAATANRMSINSWIVRAVRGSIGVRQPDSGPEAPSGRRGGVNLRVNERR